MYRLLGILFLLGAFTLSGQDVHWTQFNENPVYLNPAHSGNFKGDHRFHGNFRDQWRSVTKPFRTFSFSYDTKLSNPKWGIGTCLLHDQTGDGVFKTIEWQICPSYRFAVSKDSMHRLQTGLQVALNFRQFNFPNFYFDEQYNGLYYDPNLPITEDLRTDQKLNVSTGAGLLYEYYRNSRENFILGVSAFNLNQPNQGFYGSVIRRDMRVNLYSRITLKITDDLDLIPTAMYQLQGTYREFLLGGHAKIYLDHDINDFKALYGGLMFRSKDAFFFIIGLEYRSWYAGLSYDFNVSSLKPASSGRGGLELSVRYIISRFKVKYTPKRICPEFL